VQAVTNRNRKGINNFFTDFDFYLIMIVMQKELGQIFSSKKI
jgi:hypothetical protein